MSFVTIVNHGPELLKVVGKNGEHILAVCQSMPFELADGGLLTLTEAIEPTEDNVSRETPD